MGTVYKTPHRRMKRIVAVKVLAKSLDDNKSFVQRFQREVETTARLSHPNLVTAHDAAVCEAGNYLVMEFIEGADLDRLVRLRGALSPRLAATLILQAAFGLENAHAQSISHRDINLRICCWIGGAAQDYRLRPGAQNGLFRSAGQRRIDTDQGGRYSGDRRFHAAEASVQPVARRSSSRHLQPGLHAVFW